MSFQQGLSGLNASSQSLDVIGNNIANAGTYGAKAARAEFADVYANALNGSGGSQVGIGVTVGAITQQFTQGSITTTDSSLDLAINGSGFFQLQDAAGAVVYSRNGQFQLDNGGNIVNAQGLQLLGYPATPAGQIIPSTVQPLQVPTAGVEPQATTAVDIELIVDSRDGVTDTGSTPAIDLDDETTYNNATSVTVYDAKGQPVALTYYFQKAADNAWNVYVTANGEPALTDGSGNPVASTTMEFESAGGNVTSGGSFTLDVPSVTLTTGGMSVAIDNVAIDLGSSTEFGAPFSVTDLSQDGYAPGQLSGITIEDDGTLVANYSNGQSKAAGQLVMANFQNPQGLQALGGNVWAGTYASGDPVLGVAGEGNFGALQSGALEESNVELTAELVNMITAQRAYQANSQTIKTQDQVMQTLVNLR
jgi:flagellar hook protein FlgE